VGLLEEVDRVVAPQIRLDQAPAARPGGCH
jgi:hypothetical protein